MLGSGRGCVGAGGDGELGDRVSGLGRIGGVGMGVFAIANLLN